MASYPEYKKALWELWRTFFGSFIVVIYAQLQVGVGDQDVELWVRGVLLAGLFAGVRAVVEYVRKKYMPKKYDSFIYKVPA